MDSSKILYLCDFPIDSIGGAQKSLLSMAKAMDEIGYKVIITSDILKNKDYICGGQIEIAQWKKPRNKYMAVLSKILFLKKCVKKYKPNIIHAQFSQFAYAMLLARKYHFIGKSIPLVFTDRHHFLGYNDRYKNMFINNIEYLSKVIFTTQNNKNEWEKALGKSIDNGEVVPNVLEDKWFQLEKNNRNSDGKIYVGFAGRYVDWKRWDTVLDIADELCSDKQYVISVAISALDGEENKLNEYLNNLKNKSRGQLIVKIDANEEEMKSFYSELDFFVLTSENESFGRTLIEAMTQNCVVLCTNSGGAPEVVGRNDTIYELADYKNATKIIRSISSDAKSMNQYKTWFLERSKLFSRDSMKEMMSAIYRSLV